MEGLPYKKDRGGGSSYLFIIIPYSPQWSIGSPSYLFVVSKAVLVPLTCRVFILKRSPAGALQYFFRYSEPPKNRTRDI